MSEGCSNTKRVFHGHRWITEQDIEEQDGKSRTDAAAALKISKSELWRATKDLEMEKRPYPERTKPLCLKSKAMKKSSRLKSKAMKKSLRLKSKAKNKIASENDDLIRQPIDDDGVDEPSPEKVKLLFKDLMALTLEEISNPDNETSMKKALSILENNLTLFSEEQAEQILDLVIGFTTLVGSWREYNSGYQAYNNPKPLDEAEKIRELVKTSEIEEESLKVTYEQLESKEEELGQQLAAVKRERAEIYEERIHQSKEQRLARIATHKLNDLSEQWAKIGSSFT